MLLLKVKKNNEYIEQHLFEYQEWTCGTKDHQRLATKKAKKHPIQRRCQQHFV